MFRKSLFFLAVLFLCDRTTAQYATTLNFGVKKPDMGITQNGGSYRNGNFDLPLGGVSTLTTNTATPSVAGAGNWSTSNTQPTAITNFTRALKGQALVVICNDSY